MNIIESTAKSIAKSIRRNYPEAGSEASLAYALIILLNALSAIIIVWLCCLITGHFIEGIIVTFAFITLRYFSGGVHLQSSMSCTFASALCLIILAHLQFDYMNTGLILDCISMLILLILAPEGIEGISTIQRKYYPLLKIISLLIVGSNFFLHSSLLSAAFFAQSLTLTKPIYMIFNFLERRGPSEKNDC